jgi:hypothetical protein
VETLRKKYELSAKMWVLRDKIWTRDYLKKTQGGGPPRRDSQHMLLVNPTKVS